MAVYTQLASSAVGDLLAAYSIGELQNLRPISGGIENTNYFLDTVDKGTLRHWVLTIFENLERRELPYFADLTQHLERQGFAVPAPVAMQTGEAIFELNGKSGAIVPCLSGASLAQPDVAACAAVGGWLAAMHTSLSGFEGRRELVRDLSWMDAQSDALSAFLPQQEFTLLRHFIARYRGYKPLLDHCPQGPVHGDLFRDNVLFDQGRISGVIDFYHACDATLLFDLAVVANDWCVDKGKHEIAYMDALIDGYRQVRPWTAEEIKAWPNCLELAALRFWVSRLVSKHVPGYQHSALSGEPIKNPDEMKAILVSLAV